MLKVFIKAKTDDICRQRFIRVSLKRCPLKANFFKHTHEGVCLFIEFKSC